MCKYLAVKESGQPPAPWWWGGAFSGTQLEGSAPCSDTARWEAAGRLPPSADGNGFANRYPEDFALLAGLGLTRFRTSIEWARLEPIDGFHDGEAVEHALAVLTAAREAGLAPWVCLHHRSTPGWFADDLGGFTDERARTYHWARHVDWMAETFGHLVEGWFGIHQPVNVVAHGWFTGEMPPGNADPAAFVHNLEALYLANHVAWRLLRNGGAPVATAMNLHPLHAAGDDADSPAARAAAEAVAQSYDDVIWNSWIRALRDGVIALPGRPPIELPDLAGSFDLIGFSYYSAVCAQPDGSTTRGWPHGRPLDQYGRSIWPEGMGLVLRRLASELPGRPLVIADTGVATDDEHLRATALDATFSEVADAVHDGVDVRGLFLWSPIDTWEWESGENVAFGVADRTRTLRPSAQVVRDWIDRPGASATSAPGGRQRGPTPAR